MNRNMTLWVRDMIAAPVKKPMPILSFPAVSKMGITVRELIGSSHLMAAAMKLVADETPNGAAAVSMMDLSVEAEAFGAAVRFTDNEVPAVTGALIQDQSDVDALAIPAVGAGRTQVCVDAITEAVSLITDRPVFAGVIGPYSLAGRLTEVSNAMLLCMDEPDMMHDLLEKATQFLICYIKAFRDAGADGVLIAEPLAGLLSPDWAEEFSTDYVTRIIKETQTETFLTAYHNCGASVTHQAETLSSMGCRLLHFGNSIDLSDMLRQLPQDILVMGNTDPAGRFYRGTPGEMREAVRTLLDKCAEYPNFVISSGCDIPPASPWENIQAFYDEVQAFYEKRS